MDRPGHPSQFVPVFVGSTFEDMKDYRTAVTDALQRLETVARGMEYFGSRPGTPKDECLKAVRESRIYIGIFAMRYGTVDEETGKSMTHLELEEAELIGLPVLIYLIDEEHQPVLPRFVDTGEEAKKLAALKKHLKKEHTVSFFTTPADLARRISQDLPRVLQHVGTPGCFQQLELRSAPIFSTPARLDFGKVTVISGANGTGKTALWQWAAGIGDETHLRRWLRVPGFPDPFHVVVTYLDPLPRSIGVRIENEQIWYTVEGRPVPFQPYTIRFVVPRYPRNIPEWSTMDDQSRLSAVFGLPAVRIMKLLEDWSPTQGLITGLEVSEGGNEHRVSVRLRGNRFYLGMGQISSGELMEVLVEIAIALAAFFCQYTPTVLVLDDVVSDLDCFGLQSAIERLCTTEIDFQTIVTVPQRALDYEALFRAGANVVSLEGRVPSINIVPHAAPETGLSAP